MENSRGPDKAVLLLRLKVYRAGRAENEKVFLSPRLPHYQVDLRTWYCN